MNNTTACFWTCSPTTPLLPPHHTSSDIILRIVPNWASKFREVHATRSSIGGRLRLSGILPGFRIHHQPNRQGSLRHAAIGSAHYEPWYDPRAITAQASIATCATLVRRSSLYTSAAEVAVGTSDIATQDSQPFIRSLAPNNARTQTSCGTDPGSTGVCVHTHTHLLPVPSIILHGGPACTSIWAFFFLFLFFFSFFPLFFYLFAQQSRHTVVIIIYWY